MTTDASTTDEKAVEAIKRAPLATKLDGFEARTIIDALREAGFELYERPERVLFKDGSDPRNMTGKSLGVTAPYDKLRAVPSEGEQ